MTPDDDWNDDHPPDETPSDGSGFEWEEPPFVEGPGGGPAMPTGPGLSQDDKEAAGSISHDLSGLSIGLLGGAGILILLPEPKTTAAGFMGLLGVGASGLSWGFDGLANDPPQPDYQSILQFRSGVLSSPATQFWLRASRLPQRHILLRTGKRLDYCRGLVDAWLDSIERFQGARDADDLTWAINHLLVARGLAGPCYAALGALGQDLRSLAEAIQGTAVDVDLDCSDHEGVNRVLGELRLALGADSNDERLEQLRTKLEVSVEGRLADLLEHRGQALTEVARKARRRRPK